jgi:hypothetical protein
LVNAKKTQRDKDWPMIGALVEGHYAALQAAPTPALIKFWLSESRTPERLLDLVARFPVEAASLSAARPLLALARADTLPELRTALDAEVRAEQDKDRRLYIENMVRFFRRGRGGSFFPRTRAESAPTRRQPGRSGRNANVTAAGYPPFVARFRSGHLRLTTRTVAGAANARPNYKPEN